MNLSREVVDFAYIVFLGVPAVVLFLIGRRSGRRRFPSGLRITIRAWLWSLVLAWTTTVHAAEIGAPVFPAWLLLGLRLTVWIICGPSRSQDTGIPPAWLSVACAMVAYVIGALGGRTQSGASHA